MRRTTWSFRGRTAPEAIPCPAQGATPRPTVGRSLRFARNDAVVLVAALLALTPSLTFAQSAADSAGLVAAAKDYIEGWYDGDAARMARALHPELVKRIVNSDTATKRSWVDNQGATRLIQGTARGGGNRTPRDKRRADIKILDVFQNAAVVKIDASDWVDYLQLVRISDRWQILNVLWELRPPTT